MRHLILMEVSQGVAYRLINAHSSEGAFNCIECAQDKVRATMDELILKLNATSHEVID
jgi:hypothetical protein